MARQPEQQPEQRSEPAEPEPDRGSEPRGAQASRQAQRFSPLRGLLGSAARGPLLSLLSLEDLFSESPGADLPVPALDVTETGDAYIITAELAGVRLEDLTVEFEGPVLTIRGEKREQREAGADRGRILERVYGAFGRSLRLPADADPDQVTAAFQNGVLRIEIHKRPEGRARPVEIHG